MFNSKSRREVLKGGIGAALLTAIPALASGRNSADMAEAFQGGTNPVVKIPGDQVATPTGQLRVTVYPSTLDNPGDIYDVRAFEMQITKDPEGKFVITEKHQDIDGIEGKEYHTVVTVKDASTAMTALINLDNIPSNRVIVIGAYNSQRSGMATVQLKKA